MAISAQKSKILWLAPFFLLSTSCAELPSGGATGNQTLITLSMTMQQPLNQGFTYAMALNPVTTTNPTNQGPIPVILPPYGNGIVAGGCQYLIIWNFSAPPTQQAQIYTLATPNFFPAPTPYVPINFSLSPDGTTLTAEISISEIASSSTVAATYQALQINFLTMSVVPTGSNQVSRIYDALGNQGNNSTQNSWITVPLNTAGTYNNARYGNELAAPNWISDPTLDITNFSVNVAPG
ncbi:MAG TPA: hypothetical protein VGL56_13875 [Fimbriimonadaceae bacterium]|jgi:hypothetical protein